jgi:hypothetical protein
MNESPTYETGIYAQVFSVMGFLLGMILEFNHKGGKSVTKSIKRMDSIDQEIYLSIFYRILLVKGGQHG